MSASDFDELCERAVQDGAMTSSQVDRMTDEIARSTSGEEETVQLDRLLAAGTQVWLHSLTAKPDLNGKAGVVLGSRVGERYPVRVAGSSVLARIRHLSLRAPQDEDPQSDVLGNATYLELIVGFLMPSCTAFATTCTLAHAAATFAARQQLTGWFGDVSSFGPPLAAHRFLRDASCQVYERGYAWIERSTELCRRGEHALVHHEIVIDRGVSMAAAWQMLVDAKAASNDPHEGFYRSRRHLTGRPGVYSYVLLLRNERYEGESDDAENHVGRYRVCRPASGLGDTPTLDNLLNSFVPIRADEAVEEWTAAFRSPHCMHGPLPNAASLEGRCGPGCTIGKRIIKGNNLLSGAILRFWPEIRASWTSKSRRPKLVKLQDSAGNLVAGLWVTPSELEVLRVVLEDVRELASTEASVLSSMMRWLRME